MHLPKRMEALTAPGVFTVLAEKKRELLARGADVIDLSVGSPDNDPPPHVIEAVKKGLEEPGCFRYAISDLPELRLAAAAWYLRRYGVRLDPAHEIVSLLGTQDGLAHLSLCMADPGDAILAPDPGYPVFHAGPRLAGAEIVPMPQRRENGYVIDLRDIPGNAARRAKLMIVSYPNNPTAAVAPKGFFGDLVAFARDFDIAVLYDNAYSELVFEGPPSGSFLAEPGAGDVGVEFNSLSKTYGFAGARMGFALGNAEIVGRIAALKSHIDYGAFLPVQRGAVAALTGPQDCVAEAREAYRARAYALCDGLTSVGWPVERPKGTMFAWAPLPGGYADSTRFALELADRTGVLATPGVSFGACGEGHVRMALVQGMARIREAVLRIRDSGMIDRNGAAAAARREASGAGQV
jgi:LL-diaminopimelate aminotransferase